MRVMAEMADGVSGLRGGAMASALHAFAAHGDPFVAGLADGVLRRVSAPVFEAIRLWVVHGELADGCGEFFVAADAGVTANVVVPGMIDTVRTAATGVLPPGYTGGDNLLNRKGRPEEIAAMIRALCGPAGRYTTGQTIHVNGGAYTTT